MATQPEGAIGQRENEDPCEKIGLLGSSVVKNPPANVGDAGDSVQSLGLEDPLEEEMATHCSIFA